MKKTTRIITILLLAILMLFTSCNDNLQKIDHGSVNEYIYPYIRFNPAEDGDSVTAIVVAGAQLNTVKIPATVDGVKVNTFIGFENPEDAESVKEILLGSHETVITEEAIRQAENLENIRLEKTSAPQFWGKLPVLEKDGYCFQGWYAGDVPVVEGALVDPENAVAVPVWKAHELVYHESVAATCTGSGTAPYWECSICNEKFASKEGKLSEILEDITIPPLGHDVVEVPEKPRTCTEDGVLHHWKCTRCSSVFSDGEGRFEISPESLVDKAQGHQLVYVAGKPSTCSEKGWEEYWFCPVCKKTFADAEGNLESPVIEIERKPHAFQEEWKKDDKYHWHECSVCGEADSKKPHDWMEEILRQPTPVDKGQKKVYCDTCGKSYLVDLPAIGHEYRKVRVVAPTCLERGYTIYEDLVTHEQFNSDFTDPIGHDLVHMAEVPSSCTVHGTAEHYHCNRCGRNYTSSTGNIEITDLELPLAEHSYAMKYDDAGHWLECTFCNSVKVDSRHPHEFRSEPRYQKSAATCKSYAVYYRFCNCGYRSNETFEYEAGGYAPHKLYHHAAVEPTCTESGNGEYWECSVCGKLFVDSSADREIIWDDIEKPAKGHSFAGYVKVDDEHHQANCSVCNERYGELLAHEASESYEAAEGHGHYHICKACHQTFGPLISHNMDYVPDSDNIHHHIECLDCHYRKPGSTEEHVWKAYGVGDLVCDRCGAVRKHESSGGGFEVTETNYDPEGHIELARQIGDECHFRFVNENSGYCPDDSLTFTWSVNGEVVLEGQGSGFTEFSCTASERRSYLIDCLFIHEKGGGGSSAISVTGNGD